jgi:medium-chain acyl-[acyl-carrier-protein] hydrolase
VELCPFELPGRGQRLREKPYTRMEELVPVIASEISKALGQPFALFGHSLGACIAFELARYLKAHFRKEPAQLFVSGTSAPHLPPAQAPIYNLPDAEFRAEVTRLNGTPREILENPEAMSLLAPILRADFELIETYEYREGPKLSCPIRAFGGLEDSDALMEDLSEWRHHTSSSFSLSMMPGDHFFIAKSERQLLSILCADLEWAVSRQYSL